MKIGIDVGGSHIGIGLVNENGTILYKKEKDYKMRTEDMSQIVLDTIVELLEELIKENDISIREIELIGIAIPGTVTDEVIVKAENLGIQDFKIVEELNKKINISIHLENDAKCAAVAEKKFGSLKKYNDALFLILGTGVGGAVFLKGELLKPKRYSGFEVGHMVIDTNGERCNCGRKGCFEIYGSMKRFKEKLKNGFNLPDIDGRNVRNFMIENKENEKLEKMISKYIDDLATGIINLINIFEPEVISIGGSFAHYSDILLSRLEKRIIERKELFNGEGEMPKFIVAKLKNDAGIIGAAM